MKLLVWFLGILLPCSLLEAMPPVRFTPNEIVQSEAVAANGLSFCVSAEARWKSHANVSIPIDVQLLVTNTTGQRLVFQTFDTFRIVLKTPAGAEIPWEGGRDGTIVTQPVSIPPHGTYAICRKANLVGAVRDEPSRLDYFDGTGSLASFKLTAGIYHLSFQVSAPPHAEPLLRKLVTDQPVWKGNLSTNPVEVVVEPIEQ